MPQGPLATAPAVQSGVVKPLNLDGSGNLKTTPGAAADPTLPVTTVYIEQGKSSALNLSAAAVVKAGPGRLCRVSVSVAGAAGTVNDCLTTGAAAASNQIGVVPAAVGIYNFDWPCAAGIVYVPGAAQVASISYT